MLSSFQRFPPRNYFTAFSFWCKGLGLVGGYDVALFMERLRKYTDVQELTREMCLELIEYITLDAYIEGQPREIYIY